MADKKNQINFGDAYQSILTQQSAAMPATFDSLLQSALGGMSAERAGAIKFLEKDGVRARAAGFKANPELEQALGFYTDALAEESDASAPDRLLGLLLEKARTAGPSRISQRLEQDAMAELELGGALSDEEERNAIQAARAGMSARGMLHGNPALIAEVLARHELSEAREAERRGFAGSVNAQLLAEEAGNRSFQTNVRGLEGQHLTNLQAGVGTTAAVDPAMTILSRPSIVPSVMAGGVQMLGQAMVPALDMWSTSFNSNAAERIAQINAAAAREAGQMQMQASRSAGGMAMGGQLGGAVIGAGATIGAAALL